MGVLLGELTAAVPVSGQRVRLVTCTGSESKSDQLGVAVELVGAPGETVVIGFGAPEASDASDGGSTGARHKLVVVRAVLGSDGRGVARARAAEGRLGWD